MCDDSKGDHFPNSGGRKPHPDAFDPMKAGAYASKRDRHFSTELHPHVTPPPKIESTPESEER